MTCPDNRYSHLAALLLELNEDDAVTGFWGLIPRNSEEQSDVDTSSFCGNNSYKISNCAHTHTTNKEAV